MDLLKFLAPDPKESDEEFLTRRLNDFMNGNRQGSPLDDILPLSHQYKGIIGIKAWSSLVNSLPSYQRDHENQSKVLRILSELINDDSLDSNSISGYIVNDDEAFMKIIECFDSNEASIRALTLTLLKHFIRLQLSKVQTVFLENSRAQKLILDLASDPSDMIRTNFYYIIPSLVKDNPDLQQAIAFSLMDTLAEYIINSPKDVIPVIQSLLEGNTKLQTLFVATGHLGKLVPSIKSGEPNSISLLTLLFKSSEVATFRRSLSETDLLNPIIEQSITPNKKRGDFLNLLGYIIKGDQNFCSAIDNQLDKLLSIVMTSNDQNEVDSGIFCLECYTIKSSPKLAEVICVQMWDKTSEILIRYEASPKPTKSLLSIGCSCLISNHETLPIFFGNNTKCFFTHVIEILAVISKSMVDVLVNLLEFSAAAVWESQTASKYFVSTLASFQREDKQSSLVFLISLCMRDVENDVRSVASLLILELLLFKMNDDSFSQLITAIKTHIGINDIYQVLDQYAKNFNDDSVEQSQWGEFVIEAFRNIRKNKDGLLNQEAEMKSESAHIAHLQTKLDEVSQSHEQLIQSNSEMQKSLEENQKIIEELENQVKELSQANDMYESALTQSNEEKEQLEDELEKLRSKFLGMNSLNSESISSDSNNLELKYQQLNEQFNEMKEKLTKEIEDLKKENQLLKEKIQSSDTANEYLKENEDLRQQLKLAKQHIEELSHTDEELKQAKAELSKFYNDMNYNSSFQTNTNNPTLNSSSLDGKLLEDEINKKQDIIEKLNKELQDNKVLVDNISKEKEEIEKEKEDIANQLASMIDTVNSLNSSQAQMVEKYNEEIQNLKNTNTDTENELIEAMEKNEALQEKLNKKKSKIKQLKSEDPNESQPQDENALKYEQLKKEKTEYEIKFQELNHTIEQANQQNDELKSQLKNAEDEIQSLKVSIQTSNENNNSSEQIDELKSQVSSLEHELENEKINNRKIEAELKVAQNTIASQEDSHERAAKYEKQIYDLLIKCREKDNTIAELNSKLEEHNSIQEEFGQPYGFTNSSINSINDDSIQSLKAQLSEKETKINTLNNEIENIKLSYNEKINALQTQINSLLSSDSTSSSETTIFELQNQVNNLQNTIKEKDQQNDQLQKQISNLQWLKDTVQQDNSDNAQIQKELEEQIKSKDEIIKKLEEETKLYKDKNSQIKALEDEISEMQKSGSNKDAQAQKMIEEKESQIQSLQNQIEVLTHGNNNTQNIIAALQKDIETIKKSSELREIENKKAITAKDEEITKLMKQIGELNGDVNNEELILQLQTELSSLRSENQAIINQKDREISNLRQQLNDTVYKTNTDNTNEKTLQQIAELQAKQIDLQKQLSEKDIHIFDLEEQLKASGATSLQRARMEQQLSVKETKISSLENQVATLQEFEKTKDLQIAILQKQIDEFQSSERHAQTLLQKEQINKDFEITQLTNEVADLKAQIAILGDQKKKILEQQKELILSENSSEKLGGLESQLQTSQLELEKYKLENSKLRAAQSEYMNRETQFQSLIIEMEGKDRLIDELKRSQIELAKKCKNEVRSYKAKLLNSPNRDNVESQNQEIKKLHARIAELQSKLEVLENVTPEITEISALLNSESGLNTTSYLGLSYGTTDEKDKMKSAKRQISALLSEYKILKSKSELMEQELQQSRIQQQRQSESNQRLKKRLAKALLNAQKEKQQEQININTVSEDSLTVKRLRDELNKSTKELNSLQAKHQSALQLIGLLWTRSQSQSKPSTDIMELNI